MTIKVQTNEFIRIIKDAAIFASKITDIPVINAVHLESRGKDLIAVATDRFVLGVSKTELDEESDGEFLASLSVKQVRTLIQVAGAGRNCFSTVAIDSDDKETRIAFSSGESLTLPAAVTDRGVWRGWLRLLESTESSGDPSKAMDLNPQLVAKFAQVGNRASRIRMHFFGHTKPIKVTVGDSFVGMVMPVRMPDEVSMDWTVPEWIAPEKPVKAAARKTAAKKPARKPRPRKAPAA